MTPKHINNTVENKQYTIGLIEGIHNKMKHVPLGYSIIDTLRNRTILYARLFASHPKKETKQLYAT